MIESITIKGNATFASTPEMMSELSKFNFLFGANATGKTTISRVIADEAKFPECSVTWQGGTKLQAMVYNHDFVEQNFTQSSEMKGVFTLGKEQVGTLAKIKKAKGELDELTQKIEDLAKGLQGNDGNGGKMGELKALETKFKEKCWAQKQKHDTHFQGAFEGFRNNSEKFKNKVLEEVGKNIATLQKQVDLEKRAANIYGPPPTTEASIALVDTTNLIGHEANPILRKRVIGKEDVDIAAMIKRLNNSDWVREGREFFDANNRICPFCQQSTSEAFAVSLTKYFDETFVKDSNAIDKLATDYATDSARVQQQLAKIIEFPSRFLDVEKLKSEKAQLDTKIRLNNQWLKEKKKEASQVVELDSLERIADAIKVLIDDANTQVVEHNKLVANLTAERAILTEQVWKFVLEELKTDLTDFNRAKGALEKAITSMTAKIEGMERDLKNKKDEVRELERQTTSVQPTIDGINKLLATFGFRGFAIAKGASGTSYKLVRSDGTDAKATLSEGEMAFVTFLYFFHLLKGSYSENGMTTDRIVVFDDPVSSLDCDILFIVSNLIRGLFKEVREGTGNIKQIFVLTHNVYFHKEITFNVKRVKRKDVAMNEETFWVVRKPGLYSKIVKYETNPIKTSYQLLWEEVRKADRANPGIQNTLRRILDYYFKILGGIDFNELCSKFDGKEKCICNSLFAWLHDGSHYAQDDLYISTDDSMVDNYLKVFREIFEKSHHDAHYKMMMGDAFVEGPADVACQ